MRLNSLRPLADTLLVTRSRYLTLQSTDSGKPAKVTCHTTDVADLALSPRMRDITLTLRDGTTQRLGSLYDTPDEHPLRAVHQWLQTNSEPLPEPAHEPPPEPAPEPPPEPAPVPLPEPAPVPLPEPAHEPPPEPEPEPEPEPAPERTSRPAKQMDPPTADIVANEPGSSVAQPTPVPTAQLLDAAENHTTHYGFKATPERARKTISHIDKELVDGEFIWFYAKCNTLRPAIDSIVVTNLRTIGATKLSGIAHMVCHEQVERLDVNAPKRHLTIHGTNGSDVTFKDLHGDDGQTVMFCVEHARTHPAPEPLLKTVRDATETYRRTHLRTPEEKRADKDAAKATREREHRAQAAKNRSNYGTLVYDNSFGLRSIRIYDKGYVRIALPFLGRNAPYERLIDITTTADIGKKTGVGRAAGAVLTSGVSLLASNKRGDIYITIVTDTNTHVLHEEPPNIFNIKQARKIEGIGKAVLQGAAAQLTAIEPDDQPEAAPELAPPTNHASETDIATRLTRLNQLLSDGLITEDEYSQQRQRLLSEI